MRVRPFFWCLLAFTCIIVLTFAVLLPAHAPARLQVSLDEQRPLSIGLRLTLTDIQGLPIEGAQILSSASMTNMDMSSRPASLTTFGKGCYRVLFHLSMSGPWAFRIVAHADGFAPLQKQLFVLVT